MKVSLVIFIIVLFSLNVLVKSQTPASCTSCVGEGESCGGSIRLSDGQLTEVCEVYCLPTGYTCCGCIGNSKTNFKCYGCPKSNTCVPAANVTSSPLPAYCVSSGFKLSSPIALTIAALVSFLLFL
ncbi:hypothetical protein DLAC_07055 [Tieghemostelium lacteum]|uniref:Transmembrane protein n=1 Tax=Tieghemostelium lacteum TaxID=361077 RepID=A0A151ZE64_TIELA|nr:hypothetical protein DLAC_07055 [Tieghemostelium lacteum]|eukprot:KYQ92209.1 hypothetical protein DLAC_07055 [Tieghemostelium lacteum]